MAWRAAYRTCSQFMNRRQAVSWPSWRESDCRSLTAPCGVVMWARWQHAGPAIGRKGSPDYQAKGAEKDLRQEYTHAREALQHVTRPLFATTRADTVFCTNEIRMQDVLVYGFDYDVGHLPFI